MDRNFLAETTKGYLTNHNAYHDFPEKINEINDTIYNDLVETIDLIYSADYTLYEEFKYMSKTDQYRVLEIYLDDQYLKEDETLDEGVFSAVGGWVGKMLGSIWSSVASMPIWGQGALFILVISVIIWKREPITRRTFQTLSKIGGAFDKVGDFLKKARFTRFRYAVLQQNVEKCYKKCGIKDLKKDIKWSDYFNKFGGDDPDFWVFKQDKAFCLINCYVMHEIEKVKAVTKMYFVCLRNTQNFDNIRDLSSEKLINMLSQDKSVHRSYNFGMQSTCAEYFDIISESISAIHDLIDFFYRDRTTRQELIMTLQKDIDKVKKDVTNMDQQQLRQFGI